MKKIILPLASLALTLISLNARASAFAGDFKCYQTYQTASMNVVVCIRQNMEEGIGGSGTKVALIGPNGGDVAFCGTTTVMERDEDAMIYRFDKKSQVQSVRMDDGTEGKVRIKELDGDTTLNFIAISAETSKRLNDRLESCQ